MSGGEGSSNRRLEPRYPSGAVAGITGLRVSPGDSATLINISASGVLVESKTRFVPGTRVTVHFEGTVEPKQLKARIVRCQVSAIAGGGSLQYRTAIEFERRLDLFGDGPTPAAVQLDDEGEMIDADDEPVIEHEVVFENPRVYNRW